jgi:hypothetical protein
MRKIIIFFLLMVSILPGCSKKKSTSPTSEYKFVVEGSALAISFHADTVGTRLYHNLYDKRLRYHFANCNGSCQMEILLWKKPFSGLKKSIAGELDSLCLSGDYSSSDPTDLYPVDTTLVVKTAVYGYYYKEDFDSSQAIPFETYVYDTVKVE